jgi:hypothetical protein
MFKAKNIGASILDHFEAKLPREKSGKMDFKEIKPSADAFSKGGVAGEAEQQEDPDHMQALEAHSEEMHDAMKSGDHQRHAHAMKAFLKEHELHEKQKNVDNGPVADKKDDKHVAIAGDEYD